MKRLTFMAVNSFAILLCPLASVGLSADAPLALVPQPLKVERKEGSYTLNKDARILVEQGSADATNIAKQLAERIHRGTGFDIRVGSLEISSPGKNEIVLIAPPKDGSTWPTGVEGYRLDANADGVAITGTDAAGLFYGTQTLLQLLPPAVFSPQPPAVRGEVAWTIPAVHIEDQPRFRWRGLMLDVSRNFFNKEEIKSFLDLMAQHKMNTFHWHLTDDQGWRIEIKRYPKLTEVGAWRPQIGYGLDPKSSTAYGPDGRYGGFYTQDDIREVVAYAKGRYITIVPEIEMPGHSGAALAAYPELGHRNSYCPGNDAVFEFLQDVLLEVIDLFPGKRIHVGGDEVSKRIWQRCPKCQARIEKEGLKDENELQSYFMRRIETFLNAHDRSMIGWDEILEGGLAPNATVMSWRGIKGGIAAASADHEVVMTPTSNCYFDYRQAATGEPKAIGGEKVPPGPVLPLERVYAFDPMVEGIPPEKAKYVLGAAGNLWSEYFPNYAHLQYMTYPRACAMAELTWTEAKQKNLESFLTRLETHLKRLKAQGVNYRSLRP